MSQILPPNIRSAKIGLEDYIAEYFRPKFEEILDNMNVPYVEGVTEETLDKLIDCLKNPEGK